MIALQFQDGKFQADFGAIIAKAKNPKAVLLNSGRELGNQLRTWFRKKNDAEPNKLGGARLNFWDRIASSVNQPQMAWYNSVSVTISDPKFAQKLFGGTITAKKAAALTIPVTAEAYGMNPGTFEAEKGIKLTLIKVGGSKANALENAVLAMVDPNDPKRLTVEYLLTPSVTQAADPSALPPKEQLEAAILVRAQKELDKELKTPTPPTV